MTEGIDFSRGGIPSVATLRANGKSFVGRYCVGDLSPAGRGITAAEYQAYKAGGIDVFLYWEGAASWMLGGFAAGVSAAQDAQANILAAGMPSSIPVYFACDIDTTPEQQTVIDDCLRGAASVLGASRIGVYGSFYVCERCAANKTAAWYCQTLAWSGGQWFAGNHLEQYSTSGNFFDGVDSDLVRALQPVYGQASKFAPTPKPPVATTPVPAPKPPAVVYPAGMDAGIAARAFGSFKASNGINVTYSEDDELSRLWLASGSYGRVVDVGVYQDSPTITRLVYQFSDGNIYGRPNASEPFRLLNPKQVA